MIKLNIRNHSVKETVLKLSQINSDLPSNEELLSASLDGLFNLLKDREVLPSWSNKKDAIKTELQLIADLLEDLCPPSDELVREDNPHFGEKIRVVQGIGPYDGTFTNKFSHTITMGARESEIPGYGGEERSQVVDAWATYLWSIDQKSWVLGAN